MTPTIPSENVVFTIGHSTHTMDRFLELLRAHAITAVADVRSVPQSRFNPQFSKQAIDQDLVAHGIAYVFLGKELGARSEDRSCYENGRVQYARLAKTDVFRMGIERVKKGSRTHRVALMCAEKEPLECHRTLLVSRALEGEGMAVEHIHADGRLETHRDAMIRLLSLIGLPSGDLFRSADALIADAYAVQEQKIAYVDDKLARESPEQAS